MENKISKIFISISTAFFVATVILFLKIQDQAKSIANIKTDIGNLVTDFTTQQKQTTLLLDRLAKIVSASPTPAVTVTPRPINNPAPAPTVTIQAPPVITAQTPTPTPTAQKKTTRTS